MRKYVNGQYLTIASADEVNEENTAQPQPKENGENPISPDEVKNESGQIVENGENVTLDAVAAENAAAATATDNELKDASAPSDQVDDSKAESKETTHPKISKAAQALMDAHPEMDFSGVVNADDDAHITKPDIEKFLAARLDGKYAAAQS